MTEESSGEGRIELFDVPESVRRWPTDVLGVPPSRDDTTLPFHLIDPERFEKLCLKVAETIDGTRRARLYGVRGQSDFGSDIVAEANDGTFDVYQIKRFQQFGDASLREAVEDFVVGEARRPFKTSRFIVCTAAAVEVTDRVQVTNALVELNEQHNFSIDLYDARQLTTLLEHHGYLVARFFSPQWRDALTSGIAMQPYAPSTNDRISEALLRGPLVGLDLDGKVALSRSREVGNEEAVDLLSEAISALDEIGITPVADDLRVQVAARLVDAEKVANAAEILVGLCWRELLAHLWMGGAKASDALAELELDSDGLDAWRSARDLLTKVELWWGEPDESMDALLDSAVDALATESDIGDEMFVWVLQMATCLRDVEACTRLKGHAEALVQRRAPRPTLADEVAVRARCCLAELDGHARSALEADARRGVLGARLTALVYARVARLHGRRRDPDSAVINYRSAIERAIQSDQLKLASDALRAWAMTEMEYQIEEETFGRSGIGASLVGPDVSSAAERYRSRAIEARLDGNTREAVAFLRAYLSETVVHGAYSAERDAEHLLGMTMIEAGEEGSGLRHLVRAGSSRDLLNQVKDRRPSWTDHGSDLDEASPWERATALTLTAATADFAPDDLVESLIDSALAATQETHQSFFAPLVPLEGWHVVAALSERANDQQSARALDLLEPFIDRAPNTYNYNDDDHILIVFRIYRCSPANRLRAAQHFARLLCQDDALAQHVHRQALGEVTPDDDVLFDAVAQVVPDSPLAIEFLALAGARHPAIERVARDRVAAEIRATPNPGRRRGGIASSGLLAHHATAPRRRQLAIALCDRARDRRDLEPNRRDALRALAFASPVLGEKTRHEVWACSIELATRDRSSLAATASWTAVVSAANEAERRQAAFAANSLVGRVPPSGVHDVAQAVRALPPAIREVDADALSTSTTLIYRQLAAIVWSADPHPSPETGMRLAHDQDSRVRRTLAEGLATGSIQSPAVHDDIRSALCADAAWSVRQAVPDPIGAA